MKMMNGRHPEASREVVEALRAAPVAAAIVRANYIERQALKAAA